MVMGRWLEPPRLYFVVAGLLVISFMFYQRRQAQMAAAQMTQNGKPRGKAHRQRRYAPMDVTK